MILGSPRNLNGRGLAAQALFHLVYDRLKISANAIKLIDERNSGNLVFIGLSPHGFTLGLDSADCTKNHDRAIEYSERALDFDCEIHMPRSIDDVDPIVFPSCGRCSGSDRDPTLLFLRHPIHRGGALVNFAKFMGFSSVEENPLGGGCLPRIDVSHDADIADFGECLTGLFVEFFCFFCHG